MMNRSVDELELEIRSYQDYIRNLEAYIKDLATEKCYLKEEINKLQDKLFKDSL